MSSLKLTLPRVIGHRGACGYAPENTLASLYKAHAVGARWIEFDVMLTQDNQAIIIHDEILDTTTNGTGNVADTPFSVIEKLDAGSWYDSAFSGEKVPLLRDYLQEAARLQLAVNVEIKPSHQRDALTANVVLPLLQRYWAAYPDNILISSFSTTSLNEARRLNPDAPLGLLVHDWDIDWRYWLQALNCLGLNVNQCLLSQQNVADIKKEVPYLLAYTVNDPARAQTLFDWGVDAVFSDVPDKVLPKIK